MTTLSEEVKMTTPNFFEENKKEEKLRPELVPFIKQVVFGYMIKHELINQVVFDPKGKNCYNSMINYEFDYKVKEYEVCQGINDYEGMWKMITRPFIMSWFIKNHKKIYKSVGEEKYYEMLSDTIIDIDYETYIEDYYKLICIGKDPLKMMSKNEKKQYKKLPETFTIYRGCSTKSKKVTKSVLMNMNGPSWTIDKRVGQWFSERFSSGCQLIIMSYEISKKDVLSFFTRRKESEIFIDYTKIDLSKVKWEKTEPKYEKLW